MTVQLIVQVLEALRHSLAVHYQLGVPWHDLSLRLYHEPIDGIRHSESGAWRRRLD